jgi:CBS domain-containing protein
MKIPLSVILKRKANSALFSVSPDSSVLEAVQLMNRERIGSVLVCDSEGAVGIFTDRDVLARVVSAAKDPAATVVADVMTSPFVTVKATTTVEEAIRVITTKRCRHLPVMGEGGEILGLVSIGDITQWIVREQENQIEGLFDYIEGRYPA